MKRGFNTAEFYNSFVPVPRHRDAAAQSSHATGPLRWSTSSGTGKKVQEKQWFPDSSDDTRPYLLVLQWLPISDKEIAQLEEFHNQGQSSFSLRFLLAHILQSSPCLVKGWRVPRAKEQKMRAHFSGLSVTRISP